ncbi:MAG: hypothetical protein IJ661_08080 [Lachnospiraceae bacterium]|nr:hypothetical protein [Lachnospiraceae bacterium]MBR1598852.1 hypothetical protein [Lachnospiraceae bacterium]
MYEVKIRVEDESELYHSFDPEQQLINGDVIDYILEKIREKDIHDKLSIHIICQNEVNIENVRNAFAQYIRSNKTALKKEQKRNNIKQLWMFVIGVIAISLSLMLSGHVPELLSEIVSTVGAFSLWEAASIWIVENPVIRLKKARLRILSNTEVSVSNGGK